MSRFAQARARIALDAAGLDPEMPLEPASSVTNEVWISHDVVVRVNSLPNNRLRREADLARQLPAEVGYPRVLAYGGELGADFLVLERLPGHPLSRWWPRMTPTQRREAIRQLAGKLAAIHATVAPPMPQLYKAPQLLDAAPTGDAAVAPLREALGKLRGLPHVDSRLVSDVEEIVDRTAGYLEPFDVPTLVHGDLTFENVLWDGERLTAILDFEWSRSGPPDLDLDILLRFCAYPHLHVAPDYEAITHAEDYADVPWWLAEDYPALFDAPYVFERVRMYGIAWDVKELLEFPPQVVPGKLHHDHPYHRLQRTVDGVGHLDLLNERAPISY